VNSQPQTSTFSPPFDLVCERLGPLPLLNHFIEQFDLEAILERFVPTRDGRCRLPYAKGLGVLIRSIIVEREPIYRHQDAIHGFAPELFGISASQAANLKDDQLGRALDALFMADRGTLLTDIVVAATKRFEVRMDQLHNDSTSIKFTGQYREAKGRSLRGKRAPWITYGFSKDHRPDLKQLLFILSTSADGGVPVQFRCDHGNTNDSITHIATWEALRAASGRNDFLYVADSKLCSFDNMTHIAGQGGRLVTVIPRSRREDEWFRKRVQTEEIPWEQVWDRPNPRRKYGPRDRWYVYISDLPSMEGWPVVWVYSTLLALNQKQGRLERLARAKQELDDLDQKLQGPRARRRSHRQLADTVGEIFHLGSLAAIHGKQDPCELLAAHFVSHHGQVPAGSLDGGQGDAAAKVDGGFAGVARIGVDFKFQPHLDIAGVHHRLGGLLQDVGGQMGLRIGGLSGLRGHGTNSSRFHAGLPDENNLELSILRAGHLL